MTLKSDRVLVLDIHRATTQHLKRMRKTRKDYSVAPDAVHPNPAGHWIIAKTLADSLGLDVGYQWDYDAQHAPVQFDQNGFSTIKYPPYSAPVRFDSRIPREVIDDLGGYVQQARVRGLKRGRFEILLGRQKSGPGEEVHFEDESLGIASAERLEAGVLIADLERGTFGDNRWFDVLLRRRKAITEHWLNSVRTKPFTDMSVSVDAMAEAENKTLALEEEASKLRPQGARSIAIRPVKSP